MFLRSVLATYEGIVGSCFSVNGLLLAFVLFLCSGTLTHSGSDSTSVFKFVKGVMERLPAGEGLESGEDILVMGNETAIVRRVSNMDKTKNNFIRRRKPKHIFCIR